MKIFKIPFLNKGGLALWSPQEGVVFMTGELRGKLIPGPNHKELPWYKRWRETLNSLLRRDSNDFGVLSRRVVTTAGVNYMRDDFNAATGGADITNFNYHDSGTGTNAESVSDTGLQIPAGPARVAGTQSAPADKQYRTVATISYTSNLAITEHGIFSAATGGTLWDRSVFAAINVQNGDSVQFTYTLSIADGG